MKRIRWIEGDGDSDNSSGETHPLLQIVSPPILGFVMTLSDVVPGGCSYTNTTIVVSSATLFSFAIET